MYGKKMMKKGGKKFPDLTGDGKVTRADVLKGRGVFKHGGMHGTIGAKPRGSMMKAGSKDQGWEDAVKRAKSAKKPK